ncbi:MAG: trypsin-like peptidase domain-containing protein [Armatimonadota bacterium]|nr:trypsin-like peptidase domain-containing protein [bacterium]MCS7309306.1 trypsin-like peptidase domain-containing protein [Armatimonadota bacterium]MDW8103997.1 trypsin-like peptidase domain-containing protein [Armatimonadota bacterium]MDW8290108.1 trypsin-like peptidase domain-containing protein [Armatimonadota bacterium]
MSRPWSTVFAFVLGFAVCALIVRWMGYQPPSQSRQLVLATLDTPPRQVGSVPGADAVANAAAQIEPAVVNIDTFLRSRRSVRLEDFFGQQEAMRGSGSGVIISPDGYIITNHHVVRGADEIVVSLADGRRFLGKIVGADEQSDLAVIKVEARNLPVAELGDSDKLRVGEWAIAVGNPLGLGSTVTVGVISALNRRKLLVEEGRMLEVAIQTDAAINQGNSGGALANIHGQLIGINTAIAAPPGGGSIGIGFAIPINHVKKVVRDILAQGGGSVKRPRPWLGISFDAVRPSFMRRAGLPDLNGVVVSDVLPGSPADKAGIRPEDVIRRFGQRPVRSTQDLLEEIMERQPGDKVNITVWRGGKEITLSVTVGTAPEIIRR